MESRHPRLQPGEEDFPYDLDSVLGSPYHMDARKPIDRLLRYERVLQGKCSWTPLEFGGRCIVELGCGPLLGWGPIAVYRGADAYVCADPGIQAQVFDSRDVWVRYFLPLHQQLDALYGGGVTYAEFSDRIRSRIEIHSEPFAQCALPPRFADIVISNGVLQHILDLQKSIERMRFISGVGCRQFHLVNFTDHMSPPDAPFREIYRRSPEDYFRVDSLLNLKRPSEVQRLFERVGIPVRLVPYFSDPGIASYPLADFWRRYELSDLAIQFAFFVD